MKSRKIISVFLSLVITALTFAVPAGAGKIKVAAPTGVSVSVKSETSVKVTWDAVENADGYIVYYSTEKDDGYLSCGKTAKTHATLKGLTADTKYYFRVKAFQTIDGKKIKSDYSKTVSAKTKEHKEEKEAEIESISNNGIKIVEAPGDVQNGRQATLKIKGKPDTIYECVVCYDTTNGKAVGIGFKHTDSKGYAEWNWKVGTRTHEGYHIIIIKSNGNEVARFPYIFKTHKKNK